MEFFLEFILPSISALAGVLLIPTIWFGVPKYTERLARMRNKRERQLEIFTDILTFASFAGKRKVN